MCVGVWVLVSLRVRVGVLGVCVGVCGRVGVGVLGVCVCGRVGLGVGVSACVRVCVYTYNCNYLENCKYNHHQKELRFKSKFRPGRRGPSNKP